MSHTLLTRVSFNSSGQAPHFSALQNEVDGLVSHFTEEAANPITLASIMAGGLAFRFGRIGTMSVGTLREMPLLSRALSLAVGLGSEATTFELTHRTLQTFSPSPVTRHRSPVTGHPSPSLWSWSGNGGWQQGLLSSLLTFGMLRGAGSLAHEQNLIFQHAFQSAAMVTGHQTIGLLGITPRPEGSWAEQFLYAETTNLQMGAGMSLIHAVAPGVAAWERGLDLSSRTAFTGQGPSPFEWSVSLNSPLLVEGSHPPGTSRNLPHILAMSASEIRGGSGPLEVTRSEEFNESLRLFRKNMGRLIDRHIDENRGRWLGILTPEGVSWSDLISRSIRNSELHFGERTLRVLILKKEGPQDAPLLKALQEEFGADQFGRLDEESFKQKRIVITTPSLLSKNLRFFGKEKSILVILEDASEIFSPSVRSLITHFGFAQTSGSGPLRSKRGNGMVIGFSDSQEGLGGFLLSSPTELPVVLPRPSQAPGFAANGIHNPPSPPQEEAPRFISPTPARPAIPPPKSSYSPEVKIPAPSAVPPPVRPAWPPAAGASTSARPVWPPVQAASAEVSPQETPKKSRRQEVPIRVTPTVTEDMQKRIDAFWRAHDESKAQEGQGQTVNLFKVGQRAWQIYLEMLPSDHGTIYEHNYLQSLANHAPDDRIIQFLSQIGVRKRKK